MPDYSNRSGNDERLDKSLEKPTNQQKAITFGTFAHVRKEKRKKGQSTQQFINDHDHGYMRVQHEKSERQ